MRLAIDIAESFRIAASAIAANKGRGALTALGIIIGIVAVIITMTAANGLQTTFRQSFASVGSDVIYVSKRPWVQLGPDFRFRNRPEITLPISDAMTRRLQGRAVVNPSMSGNQSIKFRSQVMDTITVIGTTDKQVLVSNMVPSQGRFLMPFDVRFKRRVAVIGADIAEGLFGHGSPLDKIIRIGRYEFRVVGVMEKQGSSFFGGPNFDRQVYLPISTFGKTFGDQGGRAGVNIAIRAPAGESVEDFEYEVIGLMRSVRGLKPIEADDFSINKLDSLLDAYNNTMGVVVMVGLAITGIALFVGGVGVMNIMLVSVTERTREIGIRKAIGAKRRSILLQFLFESSLICLFGGVIGISVAALLTAVINAQLMPASLSPAIVVAALLVSLLVGVISGLLPAYRGARLDPIEALRYE
ncbi:MAG TPA: ABC transporter permease [Arenimonas sp.]|nr:ABC transporter permease [Arenimonas sp.]